MADGLLRGGAPMTRELGLQHVGRWRKSPLKLLYLSRTFHVTSDLTRQPLLEHAEYPTPPKKIYNTTVFFYDF